jgi:hypothetical protein
MPLHDAGTDDAGDGCPSGTLGGSGTGVGPGDGAGVGHGVAGHAGHAAGAHVGGGCLSFASSISRTATATSSRIIDRTYFQANWPPAATSATRSSRVKNRESRM